MSEQSKLGADGLDVRATEEHRLTNGGAEYYDLCRVVDAQRLLSQLREELAQRDAEIERMRSHIRTDNTETLANALAQVDRLNGLLSSQRLIIAMLGTCGMNIGNERDQLRAQLDQLQAAPAERGAPDETAMARALCNYHADLCGVNRDDQWNLYSEDFLNDVAVMLAADRRLNPAPATADSDVREVK